MSREKDGSSMNPLTFLCLGVSMVFLSFWLVGVDVLLYGKIDFVGVL
jgi:hypothetical protein